MVACIDMSLRAAQYGNAAQNYCVKGKALMIEAFQWASPADADKKTMPIDTRYGRLSKLFGGNT